MISFSSKTIENPLNLGERLRQKREAKGLTLQEVSRKINISVAYLESIERGKYSDLPGDVYAKNFIRAYSKALGLDSRTFIDLYKSESKIYVKTNKRKGNDFTKPVEKISQSHLLVAPKIVRGVMVGILAVIVLFYLGLKVKAIVTPPVLTIDSPVENLITTKNFIEILGTVEEEAALRINGQQVIADDNGKFRETVDLQKGTNVIEIKAIKRHGKETNIYRQVVVIDEEENTKEDSNN